MGLAKRTQKAGKVDGKGPEIVFGKVYRDHITGFEGKATGFCSYISGCDQVLLQPPYNLEHKAEGRWFDDDRLIDVVAEEKVASKARRGADTPAPIR
jgi:hypothetical protein